MQRVRHKRKELKGFTVHQVVMHTLMTKMMTKAKGKKEGFKHTSLEE